MLADGGMNMGGEFQYRDVLMSGAFVISTCTKSLACPPCNPLKFLDRGRSGDIEPERV